MAAKKGHPNYYKGKLEKIDLVEFGNANIEYACGLITKQEFARRCGVSVPTLMKYYADLIVLLDQEMSAGKISWKEPEKKTE